MPRTPLVALRATGPIGDVLTCRTLYLDHDNPGPDLAETSRAVLSGWHHLMAAELAALAPDAATVSHLLAVLSGAVIDLPAWQDPRSWLLGEIEDTIDDETGKPVYPQLLEAAERWGPAGCAALLDAVVRYRARRAAYPDESTARSLRSVGLPRLGGDGSEQYDR